MNLLGVIAGSGALPVLISKEAKKQEKEILIIAHRGETLESISRTADEIFWVRVGEVERILRVLRKKGVKRIIIGGGIKKARALRNANLDRTALRLLANLNALTDDAILRTFAGWFEKHGIKVIKPFPFCRELIVPQGVLTRRSPTQSEMRDIKMGIKIARVLGRCDIGQTVVLKEGVPVAVEAIEGTDATIRRAAKLCGPGAVVVKIVKPTQDMRFDIPAVGLKTLSLMDRLGARVLALQALKTFIFEKEKTIALANKKGITIVGVK